MSNDVFYDNGLSKVAVCKSKITNITPDGKMTYYGHSINDLVDKYTYPEIFLLLTDGKLPSNEKLNGFLESQNKYLEKDEELQNFIDTFSDDTNPMLVLNAVINFIPVKDNNFLWSKCLYSLLYIMSKKNPEFDYKASKVILGKMFILHADLALNCSTFALRTALSGGATLNASISAGISALSGIKHGSANLFVLDQMFDIYNNKLNIDDFINNSVENKKPIYGFGHRVFRTTDPRAVIIKKIASSLVNDSNKELFEIYNELETKVVQHEFFAKRKIFTNVDYWTSFVYHSMSIKKEFMPCMFLTARIPGWIAHYYEALNDIETKIVHPQQIYEGK